MKELNEKSAELASTLLGRIKEHPFPTVIAGIGVGWLILENLLHKGDGEASLRSADTKKETMKSSGEGVGLVREKMRNMGEQFREKARGWGDFAGSRAKQFGATAMERIKETGGSLRHTVAENPLAALGIALAAGAVLGMSLPEMENERKLKSKLVS